MAVIADADASSQVLVRCQDCQNEMIYTRITALQDRLTKEGRLKLQGSAPKSPPGLLSSLTLVTNDTWAAISSRSDLSESSKRQLARGTWWASRSMPVDRRLQHLGKLSEIYPANEITLSSKRICDPIETWMTCAPYPDHRREGAMRGGVRLRFDASTASIYPVLMDLYTSCSRCQNSSFTTFSAIVAKHTHRSPKELTWKGHLKASKCGTGSNEQSHRKTERM